MGDAEEVAVLPNLQECGIVWQTQCLGVLYRVNMRRVDSGQIASVQLQLQMKMHLASAKRGLTVRDKADPRRPHWGTNPQPIFFQDGEWLCMPKFAGIEMFGSSRSAIPESAAACGEQSRFQFAGQLDPERRQHEAFDNTVRLLESDGAAQLCLGCGKGKTVTSICVATHLRNKNVDAGSSKTRILVVAEKGFLLDQWAEEFARFVPGISCGTIRDGRVENPDAQVVFAMIQTLLEPAERSEIRIKKGQLGYGAKKIGPKKVRMCRYPATMFNNFAIALYDEGHHMAGNAYNHLMWTLGKIPLHLCITATPERARAPILQWWYGSVSLVFKNQGGDTRVQMIHLTPTVVPTVHFQDTSKWEKSDNQTKPPLDCPKMIADLINDEERLEFVCKQIAAVRAVGRITIVVSEQNIYIEKIQKILVEKYRLDLTNMGVLVGGMKPGDIAQSKACDLVLTNYAMASEAFNKPNLDTIVFATPRVFVEQAVGRVLRKFAPTIKPLVVDFFDHRPMFENQARERMKFYEKECLWRVRMLGQVEPTDGLGIDDTCDMSMDDSSEEYEQAPNEPVIVTASRPCLVSGLREVDASIRVVARPQQPSVVTSSKCANTTNTVLQPVDRGMVMATMFEDDSRIVAVPKRAASSSGRLIKSVEKRPRYARIADTIDEM